MAGSYEDFFVAVANDDARTVQALLVRGFDPNTVGPRGQVPLYAALQAGSLKVADALWQHPSLQIDAANATGETPLMMAALRGQLDWCQRLVARGAPVDRNGWTPLLLTGADFERFVEAEHARLRALMQELGMS